jgi:uncharacterized glyoxalase superfamily protein PhnB
MNPVRINKVTPILIVDSIEPALALWTGPLGYEKQVEVPYDGKAGFVLLTRGGTEIMMQTRASIEADVPAVAKLGVSSALYMDVESLEDAIRATPGAEVIVAERTTFYGAREVFIKDAAGNVLGFAQHVGH